MRKTEEWKQAIVIEINVMALGFVAILLSRLVRIIGVVDKELAIRFKEAPNFRR
jgi:hypothetical protein